MLAGGCVAREGISICLFRSADLFEDNVENPISEKRIQVQTIKSYYYIFSLALEK